MLGEKDILWMSEKETVRVVYSRFDCGAKYKVQYKIVYVPEEKEAWKYDTAFETLGEAINYAKKMYDGRRER